MKVKIQQKINNICYYCGSPAVSKEHIPPKSLFPKEYRKNLITVPSCHKHNTFKSGEDEYFVNILRTSVQMNDVGLQQSKKATRSFIRNKKKLSSILIDAKQIIYDGKLTIQYNVDKKRLDQYFVCLAKGIYFAHYNKRFYGIVDPIFLPHLQNVHPTKEIKGLLTSINALFSKIEKIGGNPKVFFYQVKGNDFLLTFYEKAKLLLIFLNENAADRYENS